MAICVVEFVLAPVLAPVLTTVPRPSTCIALTDNLTTDLLH